MNKRTKEEQKKIATAGGIASGQARRKKKTMQELAKLVAASPVSRNSDKKALERIGVLLPEDMTNDALVIAALFNKALEGDVKAIEKWIELSSEEEDNKIEALKELLGAIGKIE
jgi:hypothetical protein